MANRKQQAERDQEDYWQGCERFYNEKLGKRSEPFEVRDLDWVNKQPNQDPYHFEYGTD